MAFIRLLLLFILTSLLTSCGFHLRGSIPLPRDLETIYIQSSMPFGQFEQKLRRSLRNYKVDIATKPSQSPITLDIISTQLSRVSSLIGEPNLQFRQYTLTYTVTYQVLSNTKDVIIPEQSVKAMMLITANEHDMMTMNGISVTYSQELQSEAIFRLISHLTSDDVQAKLQKYFRKAKL